MFYIVDGIEAWMDGQWERIKTIAFLPLMGAFIYGYFTGLFIT